MKIASLAPKKLTALAVVVAALTGPGGTPLLAAPVVSSTLASSAPALTEQVAVARRTTVVRGPHGGTAVRRTTVARPGAPLYRPPYPGYRPPGYRPGYYPPPPGGWGWARPNYAWYAGGAVAAGAALGFLTAAAVASTAGRPPAPGLCWYYTNPQRTQGFWDNCP